MKAWKWAALVAALVTAGGLGAAFAPPVHGQKARVAAPRALEIFGGRGSQIGVSIRDVEDDDAKTAKLPAPGGVVIEEVSEDSPAAKAGHEERGHRRRVRRRARAQRAAVHAARAGDAGRPQDPGVAPP